MHTGGSYHGRINEQWNLFWNKPVGAVKHMQLPDSEKGGLLHDFTGYLYVEE